MKLYAIGLGLVIAFTAAFGVVQVQQCKEAGTSTKECASQLWENRVADYSTLNG